jgi:transposase
VTDDEWDFVAPYLALMRQDAPQRVHDLRKLFNALRYVMWNARWVGRVVSLVPDVVMNDWQAMIGRL